MSEISVHLDADDLLDKIGVESAVDYFGNGDTLDQIDMDDAIDHYGQEDILDQIGEDAVMEHFGLFKKGMGM